MSKQIGRPGKTAQPPGSCPLGGKREVFGRLLAATLVGVVFVAACSSASDDAAAPAIPAVTATPPTTDGADPADEPLPTSTASTSASIAAPTGLRVGAAVLAADGFAELTGQRIGVILNQASTIDGQPLLDVLARTEGIDLVAAFGPEHGVRGTAAAGAPVTGGIDATTGVRIHSLYGDTRAPTPAMLAELDVLVFDLQDVGARVYTYLATMGLAMQSAAEAGLPFIVLDRPNPLGGSYVDGHVRDEDHASFIGQYPVPAAHGMTAGELALAIKGEGWLPGLDGLDLRVVEMSGWHRDDRWADLGLGWAPPSPSLPSPTAAEVYPGTVLFEATSLSVGRGTAEPFTTIGAPWVDGPALAGALNELGLAGVSFEAVTFVPEATESVPAPPYAGETSHGVRVVIEDASFRPVATGLHLLVAFRDHADARGEPELVAAPKLFDLLTGTDAVRTALEAGASATQLIEAWSPEVAAFEELRRRYLLYD
ncbi:MAG: DUF1343 domain-containing protein [Acidimicrobiia bacterium]|nr:DUF1343 domain-containing protein [Acidimicrobiia bacterium]